MTRRFFWVILFFSLSAFTAGAQEISPRDWPKIAPLKRSFSFPDVSNPAVDLVIPGADGAPLYKLECRSADSYQGTDFEYTGDFECRLNSVADKDSYSTLLTYDPMQTRDYESRGRFFLSDLEGRCGDYPEYGRVRTFRLRGMRLRLALSFGGHGGLFPSNPGRAAAASLRVSVEARPDPGALTQIAEEVPYVDPAELEPAPGTRTCATVKTKPVPGAVTANRWTDPRMDSPYPPVTATEKTAQIPPRELTHSPRHPQRELLPTGDVAASQWFYLPIAAPGGGSGYDFECSSFGERLGGAGLRCGLFLSGSNVNLLAEGVDRYTRRARSIFLPQQLAGKCGAYPEWGAQRQFRLRGMKISVEMTEIVAAAPSNPGEPKAAAVQRAKMRVRVERDATATAPVAMPTRVLDWDSAAGPGTCKQILVNPREK